VIIVRLYGGLGNQLFQYATARRVAHVNSTGLKLDISGFESYKLHAYSLGHLNIREQFASPEEIARINSPAFDHPITYALQKLLPYHKRNRATERHFHFDADILLLSKDVYLDGYWQSEKYFQDIEGLLREEFTVKSALDPVSIALSEQIRTVPAVSLHIRRRDYVSDPVTQQIHGVCSLDYYAAAIAKLSERVEDPYFFVFSDDPQWAQANLKLEHPTTFVTHNGPDKNYEDLRLMSLCHHHIIANSTFSWWGAWLGVNPEKIVIAPEKWFRTPDRDSSDIIPGTWQRI
jgi:hypothetical protein